MLYSKVDKILIAMFGECIFDENKIFSTYVEKINKHIEWLSKEHKLDTYRTKYQIVQSNYLILIVFFIYLYIYLECYSVIFLLFGIDIIIKRIRSQIRYKSKTIWKDRSV